MKYPQVFASREAASKKAAQLRKKYISVVVHRQGTGWGVSYSEDLTHAALKKSKPKTRK